MNRLGSSVQPPLQDGYDAYDPIRKWGKGSGLYKTTDGGKTWRKITAGLPTCELGRIGLDYYRKNPNIVYAVVDSARIGTGRVPGFLGVTSETAKGGGARIDSVSEASPAQKAGLQKGDVIIS
ncbi:MAG: PDZ domain-containing protein, partial [Gemmataceae bacterium]